MTHEEKVNEARSYFDKMTDATYSVSTIEGLYAATIRRYVAEGVTTWEELGFNEADVANHVRQAKVREAQEQFSKMTDATCSVATIEELYAATIRQYVAEGVTTWEELGFNEADVAMQVNKAKGREISRTFRNLMSSTSKETQLTKPQTPLLDKFKEYPRTPSDDPAVNALFAVMDNLHGRKNIKWALKNIDNDVMEELLQTNLGHIKKIVSQS